MKPVLLFIALCFSTSIFGQLAFQEITAPADFAMAAIRQSPTGEYFVKASHELDSIYTSTDGNTWIKTHLPNNVPLENMQFFSDGTPVMQTEHYEHLVRRNGAWHTMQAFPLENLKTSFIKDDTLFTFQEKAFYYSLDKGETFTEVFEYNEPVNAYDVHMWKFDRHYVLEYSYDGEYFLSVFEKNGTRVLHQELYLSRPNTLYNTCGEVVIFDAINYYRINQALTLTDGALASILPGQTWSTELYSADGNYFLRQTNALWRSSGCVLDWEIVAANDTIEVQQNMWITPTGDALFYEWYSDHFFQLDLSENTWDKRMVNINHPFIASIDESNSFHHAIATTNNLFTQHLDNPGWIALDTTATIGTRVQFSPDGDLYVTTRTNLLHSKDNGTTFTTINPPPTMLGFDSYGSLTVLDNDILFYFGEWFDESYYTIDNGAHWIPVSLPYFGYSPVAKLARNTIVIAGGDFEFVVAHIDLVTHEVTSEASTTFINAHFSDVAILDDGTVYINLVDFFNNESYLVRYQVESGFEIVTSGPELANLIPMIASGNNLYGFEYNTYFLLTGNTLVTLPYEGLPADGGRQFYLGESEHLFVVMDNHQIFRSTEPLSHAKYLSGNLFFDQHQDCLTDTLDPTLASWVVTAYNDHYVRSKITDVEGNFNFDLPDGTYTLSVRPPSHHWDVCTASYPVTVDSSHADVSQDFQAIALSHCANLEIDFSTPLLRRCFENVYTIRVRNTGPLASLGTTVRMQLDPYFEFISATLPHVQVDNHIYTFDLGVLELNEEVTFRIVFRVSCDAPLGAEHCLKGSLEDDNLCGERSQYEECQENIGSYDPNDKRVFNEAGHEVERVDKGEYIYYHIRFQNTGTDTAFNVRINDPLSPQLDYLTIDMLSASHPYWFQLTDGPALVIFFDNILLPDSNTNEPASHGFIKFRIKPLPEYEYGTSIPNTAGIYFDFNDPVLTNTVTTQILPTVKTIDPQDLIDFNVFPNPAGANLQITMDEDDRKRVESYEVVDLLGRELIKIKALQSNMIDVSHLTQGIYNVVLREHGVVIGIRNFIRT